MEQDNGHDDISGAGGGERGRIGRARAELAQRPSVRPVTGMWDILTNLDDISFCLLGERGRPWRNMQFSVS